VASHKPPPDLELKLFCKPRQVTQTHPLGWCAEKVLDTAANLPIQMDLEAAPLRLHRPRTNWLEVTPERSGLRKAWPLEESQAKSESQEKLGADSPFLGPLGPLFKTSGRLVKKKKSLGHLETGRGSFWHQDFGPPIGNVPCRGFLWAKIPPFAQPF